MDVEITKQNGDSTRLSDLGITVRDFVVSSVNVEGIYSEVEGRAGTVDYGADFGSRTITVPFYYKASDLHDVPLLRDELFGLVVSSEPFYVREMRRLTYQTGENLFVGGKRYLVRISGNFDIGQEVKYGFDELVFETVGLPFAESIGTTQDLGRNGLRYSDELLSYGMGLLYERDAQKFTHQAGEFVIYNAGNVGVHPFDQYLSITVDNAVKGYTLRNKTNGDEFKYSGKNDGKLLLDGANITLNGLQCFRDTNRSYISLEAGWNYFEQNMAKKVQFDFRFYYQ